jgi:TetR/AcrR family transcriptional regulator
VFQREGDQPMANDVEHAAAPPAPIVAGGRPTGRADLTARSRERILRAALEEFAIKGFDGTTTAAIARHAGVTQPLVHYHFTSKIVLWRAAVHSAFEASVLAFAGVEQELRGLGGLDRMKVLTRRYVRFSASHPELARIVSHESMQGGERLQWLTDEAIGGGFDWFRVLYEQGIAEGWMKPLPVMHVLSSIGASGAYLFMVRASMWETYGVDVTDPVVVEEHADTVIEMFFHGLVQEVRP